MGLGHGGQFADGVDEAVGVGGGGADDEDGVGGDGGLHGGHVGAEVGGDGDAHQPDAEVVGGFVEGGVGGGGQDHLGGVDTRPVCSGPFAGGQHGHENALCAAGGHVAYDVVVAAEQAGAHGYHFGLKAAQAGEGGGV